jgi:hypothetical protein
MPPVTTDEPSDPTSAPPGTSPTPKPGLPDTGGMGVAGGMAATVGMLALASLWMNGLRLFRRRVITRGVVTQTCHEA